MNASISSMQFFNEVRFERMACGDVVGFHELADEFFSDVRQRMDRWPQLLDEKEYRRLGEDFHRCKGGAAMFGLERLYTLFGSVEVDSVVELDHSYLERFASELEAAQSAVAEHRGRSSDA